jgi:hypothetical protein
MNRSIDLGEEFFEVFKKEIDRIPDHPEKDEEIHVMLTYIFVTMIAKTYGPEKLNESLIYFNEYFKHLSSMLNGMDQC